MDILISIPKFIQLNHYVQRIHNAGQDTSIKFYKFYHIQRKHKSPKFYNLEFGENIIRVHANFIKKIPKIIIKVHTNLGKNLI